MEITFPHISGPFDGMLRFTTIEKVRHFYKEDDFVTKNPHKKWYTVTCVTYKGSHRAIRFTSVDLRNKAYNKLLQARTDGICYLGYDDFVEEEMAFEQAYTILAQASVPKDLVFETARLDLSRRLDVFARIKNIQRFVANPSYYAESNLTLEYIATIMALTLPIQKLPKGVTRKQYFKYKCASLS